ncbi:putative methyltransferase-domain-containing protein [Scheffersomyces amazonensis]|uniref:putative methyltransferase-domain-containing protein n=1 Tax=Scheffersomyces amazonensis TaxID=1078765 RepID=UPI00315DEB77
MTISYDDSHIFKLIARLDQRIPIGEIFSGLNLIIITSAGSQDQILHHIEQSNIIQYNAYYVQLFLKRFISLIEKQNEEVAENIYELFCSPEVLSSKELDPTVADVLQYPLDGFDAKQRSTSIIIKETPRLISGINTTGLRTWEAALFLSNYLNDKSLCQYDFKNKTILELGAGTGLLSLSLLKTREDLSRIILTDGSLAVFDNFENTLKLNGMSHSDKFKCQQLLWGTTNEQEPETFNQLPPSSIDMLVASDVTYDSRLHDLLCSTIHDFFSHSNTKIAIIAATVRNDTSNNLWEDKLNKWFGSDDSRQWSIKYKHGNPEEIDSMIRFRKGTPEIRIYEITNNYSLKN